MEKTKLQGAKSDQWFPGIGGGGHSGTKKSFGVIEMFYILIVVVITQIYTFVKTHRTVYPKIQSVGFTIRKLYLNKSDLKHSHSYLKN